MVVAEFGKGNVLITPMVRESLEKCCLILQNGKGTGVVGGKKSNEGFTIDDESIILSFENTASVDVVIRNLEQLKRMMDGEEDKLMQFDGFVFLKIKEWFLFLNIMNVVGGWKEENETN
ncbi:MAG: hypothetical protein NC489_19510 [Ruminococcus flavefaciens]|nr:hypothetical protein [Ruminococcus flavefaciens]